jgi:hypothetical protein
MNTHVPHMKVTGCSITSLQQDSSLLLAVEQLLQLLVTRKHIRTHYVSVTHYCCYYAEAPACQLRVCTAHPCAAAHTQLHSEAAASDGRIFTSSHNASFITSSSSFYAHQ